MHVRRNPVAPRARNASAKTRGRCASAARSIALERNHTRGLSQSHQAYIDRSGAASDALRFAAGRQHRLTAEAFLFCFAQAGINRVDHFGSGRRHATMPLNGRPSGSD